MSGTDGGPVYVAIDQGGHASRALAYDAAGRCLGAAFASLGPRGNALGHVEYDADDIDESLRAALQALAAQVPAARWRACGLATQRSTIACWDRHTGAALAPVISWQDRRNADWLRRLRARSAEIHRTTGLPLSPHYGASKLRWCLDHVPAVREAARTGRLAMGPLASLLLYRLLREHPLAADPANASRTQLWSPASGDWSDELLAWFDVPRAALPACRPTLHPFGTLEIAGHAVPLVACTGDQAAAPYANGPLDPAAACVNLGTGAFVLRPTTAPLAAPPLLTSVLARFDGETDFALEGTVNGAGSAIDWFAAGQGADGERLLAALDGAPLPAIDAPFFVNGVGGLASPFWIAELQSRFVGDGDEHARFAAVVESIAFLLRANLDEMRRHCTPPSCLRVSGGLAASTWLCRLLATLAGVPVDRLRGREATARGLAWLVAGRPAGWQAEPVERILPGPPEAALARYLRWLALLPPAAAA